MKKKTLNVKLLSAIIFLASIAAAQAAPLTIRDAWFRSLPGGLPAAGYFIAYNSGVAPLDITGARSDSCGAVMLHKSRDKGGMSGMDMVERVTVPAGDRIAFAPGGYHLMCSDPKAKMKIGARVPVVLTLSDGTAVAADFAVRGATGR